jgi:hypothetical protein
MKDDPMDSLDNFRERLEVLEQQTKAMEVHTCTVERRLYWWCVPWCVAALGLALALPLPVRAKTFHCGAGDVPCLIDAINAANANGEKNTIRLEAGTYTLTTANNNIDGPNGLPSITSTLTIRGVGAQTTIIERDPSITLFQEPMFRIIHVDVDGNLTLERLAIQGGHARFDPQLEERQFGGGLLNNGSVRIRDCIFRANRADHGGGVHTLSGTVVITRSTLTGNTSIFGQGGGFGSDGSFTDGSRTPGGKTVISNSVIADNQGSGVLNFDGDVSIVNSTVARNTGSGIENYVGILTVADSAIFDNFDITGGGVFNLIGEVHISNTTIARNTATSNGGGVYADHFAGGTLTITNSTISENTSRFSLGGGLFLEHQGVQLQNAIIADNSAPSAPVGADCTGSVTSRFVSLGNNLIGALTGCTISLQPSDLTGDPGLGTFTDDCRPGNGHFPLLSTSQAIDAGNDATCPRRDQLGQRRVNIRGVGTSLCDIGAIEFLGKHDRRHGEDSVLTCTSGLQLPTLEPLPRRPGVAEMVNGRRHGRERERLKRLAEHLLQGVTGGTGR